MSQAERLPALDDVLVLKPGTSVELMAPNSMFVIAEKERRLLSSRDAILVASLVDGRRSVDEILEQSSSSLSEAKALYILGQLMAGGYIVRSEPELPAEQAAYWYGLGLNAKLATDNLKRTPVRLHCLGEPGTGRFMADALLQAGMQIDDAAPVQVVVTDDYLRPELAAVNTRSFETRTRWFLVQPFGTQPLMGPLFRPDAGPCWECLAFYLRCNRPVEQLVSRRTDPARVWPRRGALEASARTICGLAALQISKELARGDESDSRVELSRLLALDLASFQLTSHTVVKRPQCPACGDPVRTAELGERPVELQPVSKTHCSDGGYRSSAPSETWDRYSHLISPISGPVAYVVPVTGRNSELRSVFASGYLVCPRQDIPRTNSFDKRCAGKGKTVEQAKTSALCEALERFSGVFQGDESRVRASLRQLGGAAVAPDTLTNFSEAQYRQSSESSASARAPNRPPARLEPDTAIDWTPAWSLSRATRKYVPLAYCYSEVPPESGSAYCDPCGNGVAAGACLEEAVLQGLLELVERDAVAIWWYNRILRPAVDLESFHSNYFSDLARDYAALGWKMWALDLTHDLGISTFAAIAHHAEQDRFSIGFGCHLDPQLALQRALTELNQLFEPNAERRAPWDAQHMADRGYLFPHPDLPNVGAHDLERIDEPDLKRDIERCLERLDRAGLEAMVVNKTRRDIGLCVAQVVVPGLRHFWPRFGPGRLYEVPCALGWQRLPSSERDLNPVPLFV